MRPRILSFACIALLVNAIDLRAQFVWTGGGADSNWTTPGNWLGGSIPTTGGDVGFGNALGNLTFSLNTSPTLNSLNFAAPIFYSYYNYGYHYETYDFGAPGPVTLTIGAGGITTDRVHANFSSSVAVNLSAPQTWYIGDDYYDPVQINGTFTNNGNTFVKDGYGALILNGTNNLTGTFTLHQGALTLGNNNALGTATLLADSWGILQSPGNLSLSNPITISGELDLNTFGGSITLSGPIAVPVGNYAYIYTYGGNSLNLTGTVTMDSPIEFDISRNSIVTLSGLLTSSGTPQIVTLYSEGTLLLNGSVSSNAVSSYVVYDGNLIFGSPSAIPTGATSVEVYGGAAEGYSGYAGLGASGVTAGTFLGGFNKSVSSGTIGFDNGITITDPIDLTGFHAEARLGSATTATLTSAATITPQGTSYNFGGGGGTLTVGSDLTGTFSTNVISPQYYSAPLSLVLAGTNTYSGGTSIDNSVIRFASASAFPASGVLSVKSTGSPYYYIGRAYVGFGYSGIDLSTPALSSALGSRFSVPSGSSLVIGFDSPGVTSSANTIDLSGFPTGTYLGTSTSLTLSGSLVPPAGVPLALAAVKDGHLTVTSNLTGSNGLTIGLLGDDYFPYPDYYNLDDPYNNDYHHQFDDGVLDFSDARSTVTLAGNNSSLSGTVLLKGGRLELGQNQALGSGLLQVDGEAVLAASASGLTIPNAININDTLGLDSSANSFTLSGPINGYSLVKLGAGTVNLTGDVTVNLYDYIRVQQGTLDVSNTSFTSSSLYVNSTGTVNFHTTQPVVYDLYGDAGGTINLDPGTTLEIQSSGYYAGTIAGGGGLALTGGGALELAAANSYSGGTTISGNNFLLADANGALGPGAVQLSGGGLALGRGVTFSNTLNFTGGTLGGIGTFAPASGIITIGSSQAVAPGVNSDFYYGEGAVGTLSFSSGLVLSSGGTYFWDIMDVNSFAGNGWSLLSISGALTISSTPGAPFTLSLSPYGYAENYGTIINFNPTLPYSWTVVTASGGITGFTPTNFVLDSTFSSLTSGYPYASFNVTQIGNSLVLNFSPVPEPSTYALMIVGLATVFVSVRRRLRIVT